jgi:LAS superfamily LD-carboxypeptidase LdcB/muramidase (phage lysozyme)
MALTIEQRAFLDLIAYCEGTIGRSANGYDLLFGGTKVMNGWETNTTQIRHRYVTDFGNYVATPSLKIQDPTWKSGGSTAAGRYQFLGWVWASETKKKFNDENAYMTKDNQDNLAWLFAEGRGMNNEKLKKGLTNESEFETTVKTLCRPNVNGDVCIWEAFYKIFVVKNYGITIGQAFEFYKGAYQKYKDRGTTGTQVNQNTEAFDENGLGNLLYLNQQGKKVDKFGTDKIIGNGDNTKFYVNIPNGSSDKIIYFWPGLESVNSRKSQWDQIPGNIKGNCYIVMAAGTTNQNTLTDLRNVVKSYNSSIKTNQLKEYIIGYSTGGYQIFNNYDKKFKLVGLIDPSLALETNTENRKYGNNVAMVWGSNFMTGISNWGVRYPKLNNKIKDDGGFSQKIDNLDHNKAIQIWFGKYGDKIIAEQASQPIPDLETVLSKYGFPESMKNAIRKLKNTYGVNITEKEIKKELEQEGTWRVDNGKVNAKAKDKINQLIDDAITKFPSLKSKKRIISDYRSYNDQADNFGKKVRSGRSLEDVQSSNTIPGFSEHHTGLAFDIFSVDTSFWNNNIVIAQWIQNNANKYGFEVTYKTQGTLRIAEPWHLKYIA